MVNTVAIEHLRDINIEKYVLGAMMCTEGYIKASSYNISVNDFDYEKNKILFIAIREVYKEHNITEFLLIVENLKASNNLDKVNGITYLSEVSSEVLSIANLEAYIDLLKKYTAKRKLNYLSNYITTNLDKEVEDLQVKATSILTEVLDGKEVSETSETQEMDYIKQLEERKNGNIIDIKTYISALDRTIEGFKGGNLVTIFAYSSVGKTAVALQIALSNIRMKKKVLFFSLEMSPTEIRDRLITNLSNVDYKRLRNKEELTTEEYEKVFKANSILSANNGLLVSSEDNLFNIISKIQYEVIKNNTDIIFIDYINLISIPGNNKEEHYKVMECTRQLKKLALKINKPIVILAQSKQEAADKMNNENLDVWQKVSVNDIAGGASIYRDSDIVLGMYRNIELDDKAVREKKKDSIDYNSTEADKNPDCMNILVKKSRHSGKSTIAVKWIGDKFRVVNW